MQKIKRIKSMSYVFKKHKITFFIIIFISLISQAREAYYDEHAIGWHWYHEKKSAQENEFKNPVQQMEVLKKAITYALDGAILDPTEENVKTYMQLQTWVSDQASGFSRMWQKVLWQTPELDYTLLHPVNSAGRAVDIELKDAAEKTALQKLAQTSGLFFFYRSSCPYCRRFAPIVKNFALKNNLTIIPITTDGISLPEFPDSKIDQGQAQRFNVTYEPALFAVNPYTGRAYPISYGLVSEQELRTRILNITRDFSES